MTSIEEIFPPFALRVRCGPVELASVREDNPSQVAELVASGIYDGPLPFRSRWAEAPADELPTDLNQFDWSK
ncbi:MULTISPECIES: hypothetical protein [unclassified Luteococcus]|uniref:hypothetical protein n=1 Tax=unclassified Luteococcus TaxID=2639923 RepID=UPI00313EB391